MPLYDRDNALSAEAPAIEDLAELVASCPGFQRLVEADTPEAALERILVGPWDDQVDQEGTHITADELAEWIGLAQLLPDADESHAAAEDEAAASCPRQGGTFELELRRMVRPEELADGGRRDVYLFALDCISAIEVKLLDLSWTENAVRIREARRTEGPMFVDVDEETAQGIAIYATIAIAWGHLEE